MAKVLAKLNWPTPTDIGKALPIRLRAVPYVKNRYQ